MYAMDLSVYVYYGCPVYVCDGWPCIYIIWVALYMVAMGVCICMLWVALHMYDMGDPIYI